MRTLGLVVAVSSALVVFGCAAATPWQDPDRAAVSEEIVAAPLDAVWGALPRVYRLLGLQPIGEVDQDSHTLLITQRVVVRNSIVGPESAPLARCSGSATAERTRSGGQLRFNTPSGAATLSVETSLVPAENGTRLRTALVVSGVAAGALPDSRAAFCVTTGRLESQIAEGIRGAVLPSDSMDSVADDDEDPGIPGRPF